MPSRTRRVHRNGSLGAAILVIGLVLLGLLLLPYAPPSLSHGFAGSLVVVAIVLAAVWVALHLLGPVFERVTAARMGSHADARSIWRVVSYATLGIVLVGLAFAYLGDVTSTALSVGLLGAALAFVLQKPLMNVVGWLVTTYKGVYRIGDRIEIGGVTGYVTDINLMHTELQEFGGWMHGDTWTGRLVTVPNSLVVEGAVKNYTRDFPLVWDEVEVLATYESDIDTAKQHMIEAAMEVVGGVMVENHERYQEHLVLRDLAENLITTPEVRMDFAESGVKLWVLYFCPPEIRRKTKAQIVEKIWRRFSEDPRVEMAYPHLAVVPGGRKALAEAGAAAQAPTETRFEVAEPPKRKRGPTRGSRSRS